MTPARRANPPTSSGSLRARAEERLRARDAAAPDRGTEADALRLQHELQVHQIELELQNAELERSRDELEAALERYTDLYDFAPVGYFTLDRDGGIFSANLTGADLLNVPRARLSDAGSGRSSRSPNPASAFDLVPREDARRTRTGSRAR